MLLDALPEILLGTSNPAKEKQLRWLLEGLRLEPRAVEPLDVVEDSADIGDNAAIKALAYSAGGLAIASDGGLDVPALGASWQAARTRRQGQAGLRRLTAGLEDRRVRWIEAVAVAEHGRLLASWTGSGTQGVLVEEPWPEPANFWVWDIFLFPELDKTWAQLSPAQREAVDVTWMALKAHVQAFFS